MADGQYIIPKSGDDIVAALNKALSSIQGVKVDNVELTPDGNKKVNITISNKLDKVNTANKVYGTDNNGNQTTFDKDSFGQVDDVQVNGSSVVQNKIANMVVDDELSDSSNNPIANSVVNSEFQQVVYPDKEQTLTNKDIDAEYNNITNLNISNLKSSVVKVSVLNDFYYAFKNISASITNVYTKSKEQGNTTVYSIAFDTNNKPTIITLLGQGSISSNEKLSYDIYTYDRNSEKDNYYIIDSNNKISNIDVAIQMYNKAIAESKSGSDVGSAIEIVPELPLEQRDQTKLYKLQGTECIYWWNGTEYIDISSESEMLEVTEFPTSDIKQGRLYKLTKNITHLDPARAMMVSLEFTESTTTIESAYTHNPNTGKWYYDANEITVNTPASLPEPELNIRDNYYYVGEQLYQCQYIRPVVIDYYAGIYAYMNQGWRALYTENLMVDYNTGISPLSLPKINDKYVKGNHGIDYYGGLTEAYANGKYQPKEMANPLDGYTSTTIEGTLAEINTKMSSATRICGQVPTFDDLPTGASSGDMYVVKTYTDSEEVVHHNILFCWNGVDWFEYGSANIDMSPYQKWEQKIDSFRAANPNLTFSNASSVAMNDAFTLVRLEATLNTPVTDIQSPDRTVINIPNDVTVTEGMIDAQVLTHAGQFTCQENVSELPTDLTNYRKGSVKLSYDPTKVKNFLRMKNIRAVDRDVELLNVWYEKYNGEYYYNGVKITVNTVSEIPVPGTGNVGQYFTTTTYDKSGRIFLSENVNYVVQDVNMFTGELMYDHDGLPLCKQSEKMPPQELTPDADALIWVMDTTDMTPGHNDFVVGYDVVQAESYMTGTSINVNAPRIKVKQVLITPNSNYLLAAKRMESGLNVNGQGVWGTYKLTEDEISMQYVNNIKSTTNMWKNGCTGTYTFVPTENVSAIQPIRAYIENGKIKVDGAIPFDKIYIFGLLH